LLIMKRFKNFEAKRYKRIFKNLKNSLFQRALKLLNFANLTGFNQQIGKIVASFICRTYSRVLYLRNSLILQPHFLYFPRNIENRSCLAT
jgi:hypothetical protein